MFSMQNTAWASVEESDLAIKIEMTSPARPPSENDIPYDVKGKLHVQRHHHTSFLNTKAPNS